MEGVRSGTKRTERGKGCRIHTGRPLTTWRRNTSVVRMVADTGSGGPLGGTEEDRRRGVSGCSINVARASSTNHSPSDLQTLRLPWYQTSPSSCQRDLSDPRDNHTRSKPRKLVTSRTDRLATARIFRAMPSTTSVPTPTNLRRTCGRDHERDHRIRGSHQDSRV